MLKVILARLAAALLLAGAAAGCGQKVAPLYDRVEPGPGAFTSAEIPLRFERGFPYLTIKTQDKELELFLDTGANSVTFALTPEDIKGLERKETGGHVGEETNFGTSAYRRFILPEVQFGSLTYFNLLCDAAGVFPPKFTRRGRMGLTLLKDFNVLIDYRGARLVLYRQDGAPPQADLAGWREIPFTLKDNLVMLRGNFQGSGAELSFVLDTGAVALERNTGETANMMKGSSFEKIKDIAGMPEGAFRMLRDRELVLEEVTIPSLNFIFDDGFTHPEALDGGCLGNDFLQKYAVFIDFGRSTLFIRSGALVNVAGI